MTLVALLAMTTGAWAAGTISVVGSFTDWDVTANDMAYADGIYSITFSNLPAGDNYQFLFAVNHSFEVEYGTTSASVVELDKTHEAITGGGNIKFTLTEASDVTISFKLDETSTYMISTTGLLVGQTPAAAVEVEISTDQQSAEFDMPSYDATLEYDIVRNMASNVGITVNGKQAWGETAASIQVKKQNGEYPAAASTLEVSLIDILQNNATIESSNYTWKLQRLADDGQTWTDLTLEEAKLSPGTYSIVAKAVDVDGALYGGGTSCEFDVIEGYEVTVAAGEYATFYGKEAVVVEGEDAELYTIANVTESEAQLSDAIKVAPKETPLLVYNKGTEENTFLLIPTAEPDLLLTVAPEFKGTAVAQSMTASSTTVSYYVCTGKAFEYVNEDGEIAANKCWLQIGEQPATSRRNTRSIVGGGNATGIESIHNSQFTIDSYYDLNGRKVATPNRKGIYIHNGKKVVVRK